MESMLRDSSFCCCQTRAWQPPDPSLAAAKPEFGSCQTRVWQLPNPSLAAAKPAFAATKFRENGDSGDFIFFGDIFQIWLPGNFICPTNLQKLTMYAYII